ncbi:unannotated protein [freshwater metagenome]|jgi:hypothetical protein|uniref:Unannotated protein n=1 Tax=freshwater metagenome TaxID=449393 RepID=A0A6J6UIE8_9ZZZZ|nr:hypothetical protein [Actinomycetota bacterium]
MRTIHRLLTTLTALLLGLGLVVATGPAASAEQVERQISINGKEPKPNKFLIKGKIAPSTGERVNAVIETKLCKQDKDCGAKWKKLRGIETNAKGRYSERVPGLKKGIKRVYYRVSTRENEKFLAAVSPEIYIYRIF